MTQHADKALLPAGFKDVLPPDAAQEAAVVERLIACFTARGYQRVKPPLVEFEDSLLTGAGAALAPRTFRLMDPVSQKMMGLRADITPQVARIAATRLRGAPRPLRLCYGGQVLQVKGSQLRPERQFGQVGVELIGAPGERADAEVVLMAAEALDAVGVSRLSVDLNLPPLVGALAEDLGMDQAQEAVLRRALDRKDMTAVTEIAGEQAPPFCALLRASGPADAALAAIEGIDLPKSALADLARLRRVVDLIRAGAADLTLTVDPVEHRGFEYQTGISFILFARGVRGELGRGGRYGTDFGAEAGGEGRSSGGSSPESSTGFSLFMDTVERALPAPDAPRRLFLAADCDHEPGRKLRAQGWATLAGLDPDLNSGSGPKAGAAIETEARRLGCSHAWIDGRIVELKK